MNNALKAPARKEEVTILHRGEVKGRGSSETGTVKKKVKEHVFYGMKKDENSPQDELNRIRDSGLNDL